MWLTRVQGAILAAEWLSRAKRSMSVTMRKRVCELSDDLARQITKTLSRQAGLQIAHEMIDAMALG